ncbi:glycosyl transferase family 2 [Pedobacter sp. KBW06]|uniref:GtrA family protein n=1 Tax=Pedobacter sp. KBW06 TaxID=2153359 RepID=UPI000F5A6A68|nr:GtrA family protein [Pedobacter sp. KBW06]RQO66473.1 glycosyl transferase family 2 [Pedobacter sp. KBW06]
MNLIHLKKIAAKVFKFGLVGLLGTAIDFSITFLVKEVWFQNLYVANTIGFFVAASNNFYLNSSWTFGKAKKLSFSLYLTFIGVSAIGLLFHSVIIYVVHQHLHHEFYLSKCLATVLVFLWNFGANYFVTFRKNNQVKLAQEGFELSDQIMPFK